MLVQTILIFFVPKNVTNFACLQTLNVTCAFAWKNNGEGAVFYLSIQVVLC